MRQTIDRGQSSYSPNTTGNGCPFQAGAMEGGFVSYNERIDARKVRARSQSFFDHFSQATLFFNSQSEAEQKHIVDAFRFELGKVEREDIRARVVGMLTQIDKTLAAKVAEGLGIPVPKGPEQPMNLSIPADGDPKKFQPRKVKPALQASEALSMADTVKDTIQTRQIAILAADGVDAKTLMGMKKAIEAAGGQVKVIAPRLGMIKASDGNQVKADQSFFTTSSVVYDAVYVPGGKGNLAALQDEGDAIYFVEEAYKHCKPIAADNEGVDFIGITAVGSKIPPKGSKEIGVIFDKSPKEFINAIAMHRFWEREKQGKFPA